MIFETWSQDGDTKNPLHLLKSSSYLMGGRDGCLIARQMPLLFLAPGMCSQRFEIKCTVPGGKPCCWKVTFRQGVVTLPRCVRGHLWLPVAATQEK